MSDAIVLGVLVIGLTVVAVVAVRLYNEVYRNRTRWYVTDEITPGGTGVQVVCRRGDGSRVRVGSPVPFGSRFNAEIEERRAEAYEQAVGLNSDKLWR